MKSETRTIPREVTQREIGWLAGIIDGEGSIMFGKSKNKESRTGWNLYNGIHIVNTNKEMIEKCSDIIFKICHNVETSTRKTMSRIELKHYENNMVKYTTNLPKKCYQITLRNKDWTIALLEKLLPDLTEKRKRSDALLQILKHRTNLAKQAKKNGTKAFYDMNDTDQYFKLWDDARRD